MSFNYFGASVAHAATYTKIRPTPPASLIQAIINFLTQKGGKSTRAVDVGCGSGQNTKLLASYFENVVGIDPSVEIIKEANQNNSFDNVEFRVSGAEQLPFQKASVDLVTTVQAIHWFDLPKFYSEVDRVLSDKGVLAVYGYNLPELVDCEESSHLIRKYYNEILKDYVLDGSRKVYLNNYRESQFNEVPFVDGQQMVRHDGFATELQAKITDMTAFISTWSGFQNFLKKRGETEANHLLNQFQNELTQILQKPPEDVISVRYRYFLLMGQKD